MTIPEFDEIVEPNDQTKARGEHLDGLRELVGNVYPNKFDRSGITGGEDTITNILAYEPVAKIAAEMADVRANLKEGERPPAEIKDQLNERLKELGTVRIAGRLTTPPRGNFVHLTDGMNKLQIYCKKGTFALIKNDADNSPDNENGWAAWGMIDHGDFIGVEGYLFVTNTGEVSVHVEKLQFLAKAMLPMPDKMHGIADPEIRQRRRYADLIASSLQVEHDGLTTRQVFETRAKVISSLRRSLEDHGYIEVETPMLTPKATGAAAKPFETHHNALDITLYARIAPELYLKRLVVGGFEKVYELNRNFRNEGISYKHNPEFTMLEFYCAYMDVEGMMNLCEELLQQSVQKVTGGLMVNYEGRQVDFSKFERITMHDAIGKYAPGAEITDGNMIELFDNHVEANLIQPTFIIDFPKSISPLSKASPENPAIAERFELFINGMEVANGFSELNDPKEQYERFVDQMAERERGDEEAMVLDEDYIRALSYGMPPAAGIGIGIDRLVMLLTNKHSIRDVILFPHLRPERKSSGEETVSE
ncbi:MAG TPA: lysine--tRNA ligase [Pyrinomonadaceae bacterium]|jgi:lysyl-tRNA synthetase class 2|nr:lysine--tRNA ligase [Pyrinomonadaceae bacterium]